jgi:hypothetical protein
MEALVGTKNRSLRGTNRMQAHRTSPGDSLAQRPLRPLVESALPIYMAGIGLGIGCGALVLLLLLGLFGV